MTRRAIKKAVLRGLADELSNGQINWLLVESDADAERVEAVLDELADEFARRGTLKAGE